MIQPTRPTPGYPYEQRETASVRSSFRRTQSLTLGPWCHDYQFCRSLQDSKRLRGAQRSVDDNFALIYLLSLRKDNLYYHVFHRLEQWSGTSKTVKNELLI